MPEHQFQPIFDYIDKVKEELISEISGRLATKNDVLEVLKVMKQASDKIGIPYNQ